MADKNESNLVTGNPIAYWFCIGASVLGSFAGGFALKPGLEQSTLEACYNNAGSAIELATTTAADVQQLRNLLYERTAERFTNADARKHEREADRWREEYERRLQAIERDNDK